jgi:hypothetical protein
VTKEDALKIVQEATRVVDAYNSLTPNQQMAIPRVLKEQIKVVEYEVLKALGAQTV